MKEKGLYRIVTLKHPVMMPDGIAYEYVASKFWYPANSEHSGDTAWGVQIGDAVIFETLIENFVACIKSNKVPSGKPINHVFDIDKYAKENKELFGLEDVKF